MESPPGMQLSAEDMHEVQQMAQHLVRLRRENDQLRANFDRLKGEYTNLSESHQQVHLKYNKIYEERVNVERHYQQLCESWRVELEAKQKEFDEARNQIMQPRELELLRLRLMEELEVPHREKCAAFEREAAVAVQEAEDCKLAADRAERQLEAARERHAAQLTTLTADYQGQVDVLTTQVERLEAHRDEDAAAAKRAPALQEELARTQKQVAALQAEVEEVRLRCNTALSEREKMFTETQLKVNTAMSERDAAVKGVDTLTRKARFLEGELAQATKGCDALHSQLLALEKERNNLTVQLADTRKELEAERETAHKKMHAAEKEFEDHRNHLADQLADTEKAMSAQASRHAEDMARAAGDTKLRFEEASAHAAAAQQKAEGVVADMKARVEALEGDVRRGEERYQKDMAAAQRETAAARTEAERLGDKVASLEEVLAEHKAQGAQFEASEGDASRQLAKTKEALEAERRIVTQARELVESVRGKKATLEARVQQLEEELQQANAALNKTMVDHANRIDALKSNWEVERSVLKRQMAEVADQGKAKQHQLAKLTKQKLTQYKRQALHADKDRARALAQAEDYHTALLKATQRTRQTDTAPTCDDTYSSQMEALKKRHSDYLEACQRSKLED